jgi:hypothetical protein
MIKFKRDKYVSAAINKQKLHRTSCVDRASQTYVCMCIYISGKQVAFTACSSISCYYVCDLISSPSQLSLNLALSEGSYRPY